MNLQTWTRRSSYQQAGVQPVVSAALTRFLLFWIGALLPLVSFRTDLSAKANVVTVIERLAPVDILVALCIVFALIPVGIRMHVAGATYLGALLLTFSIGMLRMPEQYDHVFTNSLAFMMAFAYWILGHNIGRSTDLVKALVVGIVVGAMWETVIVAHDFFVTPQWFVEEMIGRVRGTFRASGQLGAYGLTTAGILFSFGWALFDRHHARMIVFAAGLMAIFGVWAASRRSGIFSLMIWAILLLLVLYQHRASRRLAFLLSISVIIVAVESIYSSPNTNSFEFNRLQDAIDSLGSGDAFIYQQAQSVVDGFNKWFPLGLGWGRGRDIDTVTYNEIHNGHLALLVEGGVFGFIAFNWLIAVSMFRSWPTRYQLVRWLVISFILAAVVAMIHNRFHRERGFMLFLGVTSTLFQNTDAPDE